MHIRELLSREDQIEVILSRNELADLIERWEIPDGQILGLLDEFTTLDIDTIFAEICEEVDEEFEQEDE